MNVRFLIATLSGAVGLLAAGASLAAPSPYVEDFTGNSTTNSWYYFNGACLTAGSAAGTGTASSNGTLGTPGQIPGCSNILGSYYSQQQDKDPKLTGGYNGTFPDPVGNGALRFTNGYPYGHAENGAIVSATTFDASQGVQITFKTVTYLGDSGGAGKDGADGMSFFLLDATQPYDVPGNGIWNGLGSWGGSLGYTCSNANAPFTGIVSGYIGLGIDEYGNFLNGINLEPGAPNTGSLGDNTVLGYGYVPGRIGMRGAGSVSWNYLHSQYPADYPTTSTSGILLTTAQQQAAVQATCKSGTLWNYSNPSAPSNTGTAIPDYQPILNAFSVLSATTPIANESATSRPKATPIVYNIKITQDGLLSFKYSYNGGAYQQVIKNQSIVGSNGALPLALQFGFAGSSGGSTNVHEILCFKATPVDTSASSAATDQTQVGRVQTSSQAYFAFYDANNWTGRMTAYGLGISTGGQVTINTLANWDAECNLTGVAASGTCLTTGVVGPIARQDPTTRTMLTWNGLSTAASPGTAGINFEWGSLTAAEQSQLDAGDSAATDTPASNRLAYLRGDRNNEVNIAGVGLFRAREGVLADIVDSSPTWVGPPASPYAVTWQDRLNPTTAMLENSAEQTYNLFQTSNQGRLNIIYVGANDGFLHGFRTGSEDINGNLINNASTPNDGQEVLAYMPGAVLNTIHSSANSALDFSNTQYAHDFYVDGTPGSGDLFYGGIWHTWLVGGLGAGGAAIYALDVTNPTALGGEAGFASTLVMGEWSSATITCQNVAGCGNSLGNTYGTPLIRRFHNGSWGAIFGNGYGSSSGDAGIYVMLVDPVSAAVTFYYLSTGVAGSNGISFVAAADLDGDHITDYVYAGDLKGNLWRFDLTNSNPSSWAVSPGPLFQTPAGQPITTQPVLAAAPVGGTGSLPALVVGFGTGQRTQFTTTNPTSYVSGGQSLYAVWDWNMSGWNSKSAAQYASMSTAQVTSATGAKAPYTLSTANLQPESFTLNTSTGIVDASNATITWEQCTSSSCKAGQFGWYANLTGTNGATNTSTGASLTEQIVSNPILFQGAFIVNSTIPANNSILTCTSPTDTGITYVISIVSGGSFVTTTGSGASSSSTYSSAFVNYHDTSMIGLQTNETGTMSVITTTMGTTNLLGQLIAPPTLGSGAPGAVQQIKLPPNTVSSRMTWVELR